MINHAYEFVCDECGETAYYIFSNKQSAKAEARADGWIMHKNNHCFCCTSHFMKWWLERNGETCE